MDKKEIIKAFWEAKKYYTVLHPKGHYGLCSFFIKNYGFSLLVLICF